jgi:hypothetical protein
VLAVTSTMLCLPLSASPETGVAVVVESEDRNDLVSATRAADQHLYGVLLLADAFRSSLERCKSARVGLAWYRGRQADWFKLRGVANSQHSRPNVGLSNRAVGTREASPRKPRNCADARYLAGVAKRRSFAAHRAYERWLERHTLRDFRVAPGSRAWLRAVREAQKVFPNTDAWLVSCSGAEGGHGRWVRFGGGSYYQGYEHTDRVGNWLQFRWSTFRGMYRRALDDVLRRGFKVPRKLRDPGDVRAWLSPLATALAGGWARFTGNDDSHWSASWGKGC